MLRTGSVLFALLLASVGCGGDDTGTSGAGGGGANGSGASSGSGKTSGNGGGNVSGGGSATGGSSPAGTATFTPTAIDLSADDVTNAMRGQYNWLGVPPYPANWIDVDSYQRYNWDQIESSAGNYNFDPIDSEIAAAKQRHGRFGMRVMPLCQGCPGHMYQGAGSSIPDDLAASANSLIAAAPGDTDKYVLPDWNSDVYLNRLQALVQAIAARYHDEPTFAWVDVFSYGNWGEFHLYPFSQPGGPYDTSTQKPITDANAALIVQRAAAAFDNKLLVLNVDNAAATAAAVAATSPPIGLRVDCLGSDGLAGGNVIDSIPGADARWRTAPFITEWCQENLGTSGADLFVQGEQQVRTYHISMLSSGNFSTNPTAPDEAAAFRKANVEAGYRLRTSTVKVELDASGSMHVKSTWNNDGVAPTYLTWSVVFGVRGPKNAEAPLSIDLRKVMPDAPLLDDETVMAKGGLPSGTYQVYLRVEDVQAVSPPMQLAMSGKNANVEYVLGSVKVP